MHHVERRAARCGVGDHLLQRRDASSGRRIPTAQVYEAGDAELRRHPEATEDLLPTGPRRVLDPEADAEPAVSQPLREQRIESRQLSGGQRPMRPDLVGIEQGRKAGERLVVAYHGATRTRVPHGRAIVDERVALARSVPRRHGVTADLELEGGRDPVVGVIAIALRVLPVGVEIDEPGSDDEALHVERFPSGGDLRGQRHDSAAQDPHIAGRVEARLGVEHASPHEDEVVGLALRSGRPRRALEQTGDRG